MGSLCNWLALETTPTFYTHPTQGQGAVFQEVQPSG